VSSGTEHGVRLLAVGDVWSARPAPWPAFELVRDLMSEADLCFANCEGVYADDADVPTSSPLPLVAPRAAAQGLRGSGIDVMSCANNHIFDGGAPALRSTLDELQALGIVVVGAGEDDASAARAAVVHANGTAIAFLAYAAVYPAGYAAAPGRPGLCGLRAAPPDVERVGADVEAAAAQADHVIVSAHWGTGLRPWVVHGYERALARRAIEAGADAVLCHHHHCLRGVDVHNGRPIFHGIGHFAFEIPAFDALAGPELLRALREREGEYAMFERDGFPLLPFHPDARLTMIAAVTFADGDVVGFGFVPCAIQPDGRVEPLDARTPAGARVVDWVRQAGSDAELRIGPDTLGGLPLVAF
jgi:poly-gamma-glutamate synthesis protein (capsule biosynthesis protein)